MACYRPFNFPELNLIEGSYTPSCVKAKNNAAFSYWERALFQRACSVIDFELPEDWNGSIRDLSKPGASFPESYYRKRSFHFEAHPRLYGYLGYRDLLCRKACAS